MIDRNRQIGKRRRPLGQRRPKPPAGEMPATFMMVKNLDRSARKFFPHPTAGTYECLFSEQRLSAVSLINLSRASLSIVLRRHNFARRLHRFCNKTNGNPT